MREKKVVSFQQKINKGDTAELAETGMTIKRTSGFSGKNRGVTPSVAAPGVTLVTTLVEIAMEKNFIKDFVWVRMALFGPPMASPLLIQSPDCPQIPAVLWIRVHMWSTHMLTNCAVILNPEQDLLGPTSVGTRAERSVYIHGHRVVVDYWSLYSERCAAFQGEITAFAS